MNIPNLITIFRIILIPVFLMIFNSNIENKVLYAGLVFLLAGFSDVLDGYIARKYNLTSRLGAILDPFADKLMSFAVLISFTIVGFIPYWILFILLIKETIMIMGGIMLYLRKDEAFIPSNRFGKNATLALYISITSIVFKAPEYLSSLFLVITVILNVSAFLSYLSLFLGLNEDKFNPVDKL